MDDREDIQKTKSGSKWGLILALAALVAVIAVGFFGYGMLADQEKDARVQASQTVSDDSSQASSDSSSSTVPKLADYDSTVYSEDGQAFKLTEVADGQPLVMNFWATWCPYCVGEMDDYQNLYDEYGDRVSFAFIDVADGTRETVDDAAAWLRSNDYSLPAYYDTTLEASYAYGATGLPMTVVAAANGEIRYVSPGAIDPDRMRTVLDSVLSS